MSTVTFSETSKETLALAKSLCEEHNLDSKSLIASIERAVERNADLDEVAEEYASNMIDMSASNWTYVAAAFMMRVKYKEAIKNRQLEDVATLENPYHNFYKLIVDLTEKGIYSHSILKSYTKEELESFVSIIDPKRDRLFTHIGAFMMFDRYCAKGHKQEVLELPQERWLMVALNLFKEADKDTRAEHIKESYWALSNLYMTVATPTLTNSGKPDGQLSSCFIDTVEDSLDGIYSSNWDVANLSKFGGGIGVYMGKVRAMGSAIRNYENMSTGTIPWIKQLNNTATSVDQLGQRQGAIAVYLDVFHKDAFRFSDLRLNNGDERMRARDIFTAFSIPDLFMEKLEEKDESGRSVGEWNLFCPYEVKKYMGWKDKEGNPVGLEDFYDEVDTKYFTEKYKEAVANPLLPREKIRAMDLMARIMRSQLETGTPYMFYRDEVNRANPNKHVKGEGYTGIYASNLCTEIAQNTSATRITKQYVNEDGMMVIERDPGDHVVCNLSSISLAKIFTDENANELLSRVVRIQMRMLDNTIDVNNLPILQAQITNERMRAVGAGTYGWHHLLALLGVQWETEEAVKLADQIYEDFAYEVIKASNELAIEKSPYPEFKNSEWHTGKYFERKGYDSPRWNLLKDSVMTHGVRNGYLMAPAPNSSTAKLGGSTDGTDPIYDIKYVEEKKNFRTKVTAPDLSPDNYEYYRKISVALDQLWSIRQNAARQKHIDQSLSFNLYVPSNIKASTLLNYHLEAWKNNLKTTYYVRNRPAEVCEACT